MALKLIKRNKLRVPVAGSIKDDNGVPVKFDFTLLCKRLDQAAIDAVIKDKDSPVRDFLHDVTEGWESVQTAEGEPIPFSQDNLSEVLLEAGLHTLCFYAYLKEVGAVAKN
jgi:hypothetical protein